MKIVNLCKNNDAKEFSDTISYSELNTTTLQLTSIKELGSFNSERILILILGSTSTNIKTYCSYSEIYNNIKEAFSFNMPYDVCGFVWPGGSQLIDYAGISKRIHSSVPFFEEFIYNLHEKSGRKQIDIIAYSMGCRIAFDTISKIKSDIIGNLFLVGPSIYHDDLQTSNIYGNSIEKIKKAFVLYSNQDNIYKLYLHLGEFGKMLGFKGLASAKNLDKDKISQIDCSKHIVGHQNYFANKKVYQIIKRNYDYSSVSKFSSKLDEY